MKILKCKKCNKKITIGSKSGLCQSCSLKDKKKSEEHKKNISNSLKGKPSGRKGKTHTKESREKISKGNKGKNTIHGQGYGRYSPEFTLALRKEIRERDNFVCQGCGMTQQEHFDKYNRDIEIHHIDYNKFNCNKDNLITVCKQCNLNARKDRDYWYAYYTYIIENLI